MSTSSIQGTERRVARRALGGVVVALGAALAGCTTGVALERCVPGAASTCACPSGLVGAQVCALDGTYGPCDCRACTEGASYRCACRDGREGLATCASGSVGACACDDELTTPCAPGAQGRCECDDGSTGSQLCRDDGTFGACVCGAACDEGRAIACSCDGWLSTARCVGNVWQACDCDFDAGPPAWTLVDAAPPVDTGVHPIPPDAALAPEPSCLACGCERSIPPGSLPALTSLAPSSTFEWEALFAFEEGFVRASADTLTAIDRSGAVVATRARGSEPWSGAVRAGEQVLTWTDYDLVVWTPSLARVRSVPLRRPCSQVLPLGCERVLCMSYDVATTYGLTSDEVWEGTAPPSWAFSAVPDHDAVIAHEIGYARWVDGSLVPVGVALDGYVAVVGPATVLTTAGQLLSLEGCQRSDAATCLEPITSLGHGVDEGLRGRDGAFYVGEGRIDPNTGAYTSLSTPSTVAAHDPWSNTLIVTVEHYWSYDAFPLP